jgi:zinc protease
MKLLAAIFLILTAVIAAPAHAIIIDRVVSPGGIEAWLVQDHTLPVVTLDFSFAGGAATEPNEKVGLATMTTSLLDEGAGPLDSQAYQGALEDLASSVGFSASQDYVSGSLHTVKKNTDAAFELLRMAMAEPRFDAEAVARIRADLIASVQRREESPNAIVSRVWWRNAFPNHPYGRPTEGTEETLAAITVDDLRRFVHERFGRDNLKIAIVGDISPDELKQLLDKTFGALPAQAVKVTVPDTAADRKSVV